MRALLLIAALLVLLGSSKGTFIPHWWEREDIKLHIPDISCAGCTILLGIVERYSEIHAESIEQVLEYFCKIMPSQFQATCQEAIQTYGPVVVEMLGTVPQDARTISDIKNTNNIKSRMEIAAQCVGAHATCQLFPPPIGGPRVTKDYSASLPKGSSPFQWLLDVITQLINSHDPWVDVDGDSFSTVQNFRGWNWRGADCDDQHGDVYPGRRVSDYPPSVDHNCNGIYGTAPNGTSWEQLLCTGTPQYSTVILGDSAAAHFHIPPSYMNASMINDTTFANLFDILANEFDWPQMSATTGFMQSPWSGAPPLPIPLNSLYLLNRQQNLCAHRDYQNIGVNGARVHTMVADIMPSFQRNNLTDQPVNLIYALIGNDVCHPRNETLITPDQFEAYVLEALEWLDARVAPNSHVTFIGLVDGRLLWYLMSARYHPLAANRDDVTYADVYDYLNCLGITPCWGWLNSNETIRNETTAWAFSLNQAYKNIVANYTWKNFDTMYTDYPIYEMQQQWVAEGGQPWELIEPSDGFHPSQLTNTLLAEYIWNMWQTQAPNFIPPVNPNNALIAQMFGDQGGYVPQQ